MNLAQELEQKSLEWYNVCVGVQSNLNLVSPSYYEYLATFILEKEKATLDLLKEKERLIETQTAMINNLIDMLNNSYNRI